MGLVRRAFFVVYVDILVLLVISRAGLADRPRHVEDVVRASHHRWWTRFVLHWVSQDLFDVLVDLFDFVLPALVLLRVELFDLFVGLCPLKLDVALLEEHVVAYVVPCLLVHVSLDIFGNFAAS